MKIFENDTDMSFSNGLKALLMQVFQTAASVLSHRLPHSAKPHPRFCLSEV